ncbi:MAG: type III-A CRISPR-associated RAMP protein Csm4 [Clostridiales bacterium]|nr:type III-A CRISPR-associated RAMP protein Csm4 [Clostridiales bacterium]
MEDTGFVLCADTLFSALCQEYCKKGSEILEQFVLKARRGDILISDAFPYIGTTCYLPKPILKIDRKNDQGDSTLKKAYKKLSYVPVDQLQSYIRGTLDVKKELNRFTEELGHATTRSVAAVRGLKDPEPYRIGIYCFQPGSGLYCIVGAENREDLQEIENCLSDMGLSGIGGKRSAGLGRYDLFSENVSKNLEENLMRTNFSVNMALSICLPQEEEMEKAVSGASYLLQKRSGFVASDNYSIEQRRKKDLFVFKAGSCFQNWFQGDVYDVSEGGNHAVYRYAKPLFMGVIV